VHLVGFTTEIYCDARSYKRQSRLSLYDVPLHVSASIWPSSGRSPTKGLNNGRCFLKTCIRRVKNKKIISNRIAKNISNVDKLQLQL